MPEHSSRVLVNSNHQMYDFTFSSELEESHLDSQKSLQVIACDKHFEVGYCLVTKFYRPNTKISLTAPKFK